MESPEGAKSVMELRKYLTDQQIEDCCLSIEEIDKLPVGVIEIYLRRYQ